MQAVTTSPTSTKPTSTSAAANAKKKPRKLLSERKWQNTANKPFSTGGNSDGHVTAGVFFPDESNVDPCYFSIAPSVVVGRLVDIIGKQVDLPNRNNATLPEDERICMFNLDMLMQLPSNLRMDEAVSGGVDATGEMPMLIITRGPKLPPHVEAEVVAMHTQKQQSSGGGGSTTAAASLGAANGGGGGSKKKDCTAM